MGLIKVNSLNYSKMFCTCLSVSGTPSGIVLKFTAVTHLESSMNWLDLVLNFQAWHFISKRTKVSFALSTSCSAASLLRPTFSSGADKMSRSSAARFSAGDLFLHLDTVLIVRILWAALSVRAKDSDLKKKKQKKNPSPWLWILLQFKS